MPEISLPTPERRMQTVLPTSSKRGDRNRVIQQRLDALFSTSWVGYSALGG